MFDRIHHAGLAVADLAAARTVFADRLGLVVDTTRSPLPDGNKQRGADPTDILDIPIGNSELELNAPPSDGTTPGGTHRFIEQRGGVGALHHICMHASDTPNDVAHLRAAGLRLIGATEEELASDEPWTSVAFFHPRDTEACCWRSGRPTTTASATATRATASSRASATSASSQTTSNARASSGRT